MTLPSILTTVALAAGLTNGRSFRLGERGSAPMYTTTRYWDCCKPSCSWRDKAAVSSPVTTCDKDDNPLADGQDHTSGCDGNNGTPSGAFTCSTQQPWAVSDSLAYGFAAVSGSVSEQDSCCACFQLTFTTGPVVGKKMIIQATNIGNDVARTQFDLAIPGGGVGIYPQGCNVQYNAGPQGWGGQPYGGVSSRDQCTQLPARLQPGCNFRFDWLQGANNPNVTFERISCPSELISKTGCLRNDDPAPASSSPVSQSTISPSSVPSDPPSTSLPNGGISTTQTLYGQCGGQSWTGPTACPAGDSCQAQNQYYSQCLPTSNGGSGSSSPSSSIPPTSTQTLYGQCGGQGWTGPTVCPAGDSCKVQNQYYSQCLAN